ncbi:MAG: EamA family transporter RarD [Anaerolineaceae bacterium]|jgi:chloramphenicol-sensitive protein RarD|nr:EamA family transporter RarD [Anaerolineaceae bacterium]OQY87850.1 MAG: EamA family transporter [Anaerolineae bacterium UTCFX1]
MSKGILNGVVAYALWGFFPLYWKLLREVPAPQLLGHRIIWSFALLIAIIGVSGQWRDFHSVVNWRVFRVYLIASILIGVNWLVYVWAVNSDFVIEASLGYFINPLLSVLLGVLFLRERLRSAQWLSVGLAVIGVGYLTFVYGRLPWIALALAFSFGFYGLVKKLAPLGSLYGLTFETGILLVPALVYLGVVEAARTGAFLHSGATADWLMVGAGAVTTIPLLLFASAAKQIPLTVVGVLQYLTPTLQFLLGVFVYHELFDRSQLFGFGLIWLALGVFGIEGYVVSRAKQSAPARFVR